MPAAVRAALLTLAGWLLGRGWGRALARPEALLCLLASLAGGALVFVWLLPPGLLLWAALVWAAAGPPYLGLGRATWQRLRTASWACTRLELAVALLPAARSSALAPQARQARALVRDAHRLARALAEPPAPAGSSAHAAQLHPCLDRLTATLVAARRDLQRGSASEAALRTSLAELAGQFAALSAGSRALTQGIAAEPPPARP